MTDQKLGREPFLINQQQWHLTQNPKATWVYQNGANKKEEDTALLCGPLQQHRAWKRFRPRGGNGRPSRATKLEKKDRKEYAPQTFPMQLFPHPAVKRLSYLIYPQPFQKKKKQSLKNLFLFFEKWVNQLFPFALVTSAVLRLR